MKQRFSSLDVQVIAKELSSTLCSLRLSNAYDLSSRVFLFKFAKPDSRQSLVVDSGFKCYLTDFTRTTATAPTAFVSRLRKYLRTRRVTSVSQVGSDRIVQIQFSDGQYRLFLEFYAGGNIVLTDADLTILTLLRLVPEGPEQEALRVGLKYSLENRQNYHGVPPLTRERVKKGIQNALSNNQGTASVTRKKGKEKPGDALRKTIAASVTEFSPMLIDHALRVVQFDTSIAPEKTVEDDGILDKVMLALQEAATVVEHLAKTDQCEGYIVAKMSKDVSDMSLVRANPAAAVAQGQLKYDEFHPFEPKQFVDSEEAVTLQYGGFNRTVDEFFSSVESQKLESRLTEKEETARRKLRHAKQDHAERIGGLQHVQELNVRKAQAIETNLQRVQEAIAAVNSLLAQGMDWQNVARLIEVEKARHNVVAEIIKLPLKLYENTVTLLLAEESLNDELDFEGSETDSEVLESEEDEVSKNKSPLSKSPNPSDKRLQIDVDLALSPWSNARQYYDQKKFAAVKEQKTVQSSEKALKSTERKIDADLKRSLQQEKDLMRPQRKAYWFEKFVYFISSEGYLVLGGKDAQQNDILYQRHLRKGDYYIHADLQGAASIIVKNKPNKTQDPIPPSTLSQAGTLAVATSSAWDSKAVMAAWWVQAQQVSKTAPNGDILPPGSFNIKGDKNFMPPAQLLLGFGLMFKISEESTARHVKHRILDDAPAATTTTEAMVKEAAEQRKQYVEDNEPVMGEPNGPGGPEGPSEESPEDEVDSTSDSGSDDIASHVGEDVGETSDIDDVNPLQPNGPQIDADAAEEQEDNSGSEQINSATDDRETGSVPGNVEVMKLTSTSENKGIRHITARERRILRKGGEVALDASSIDAESAQSPPNAPFRADTTAPSAQQQNIRGKHGKKQKLKTKYAHQDEEDRALAMRLLGSAAAQERAKDATAEKDNKEKELAEQKERRRRQHQQNVKKDKEAEEARRRKFQPGAADEDDDQEGGGYPLDVLDALVGAPLPGDEILEALVVCGPWDAIGSRCRWRNKLQPGTTKKGKAVKEILGRWNAINADVEKKKRPGAAVGNEVMVEEEKLRQREADLIKGIRDVEVVGVVPVGKVRVVLGAGQKPTGGKGAGPGKAKRGGRGKKR